MNKTLECPECKNQIPLEKDYEVDEVIECPFCGIELEVKSKNEAGEPEVEIIEEEK